MSRRITLVVALVLVVAAAGGGWLAGSRIKSSAQIANEAEPPEPSLITVEVARTVISNDVITRGTVRFDEPVKVNAPTLAVSDMASVVTWAPNVGDELAEGSVLVEIAGRPTFALQGDLPLFRTVKPGDTGEDIEQFQTALERLGFDPGEIDGKYGKSTEEAVEKFYESHEYEPIPPAETLLNQVETQKGTVETAKTAYDAAVKQRADATAAQKDEAAKKKNVDTAKAALTAAQKRQQQAEGGTHPDTGKPPTDEETAALNAAVADAEGKVSSAEAAHREASEKAAGLGAPRAADAEKKTLDGAREELAKLQAQVGTPVPSGEFMFFKAFPIRVDVVNVNRGGVASGELMTVSGSRLAVDSSVTVEEAGLLKEGDPVTIELSRIDVEIGGTISKIADRPGTNNVAAHEVYIEILPDEIRSELNNANVKITIPVAARSTEGDVLAVPVSALSATAGGDTIVTVEADDKTVRTVKVKPGLTASGLVEVTPTEGELTEGERVVVGFQQGSATTTTTTEAEK